MLRAAALGMFLYGLHDAAAGAVDLVAGGALEWWAAAWRMLAGATLAFAAVLVRVSLPGGLALAVAALLGLQSISLHNDPHFYGRLLLLPQLTRAAFSAALVALAWFGWGEAGDEDSAARPPRARAAAPDEDTP